MLHKVAQSLRIDSYPNVFLMEALQRAFQIGEEREKLLQEKEILVNIS